MFSIKNTQTKCKQKTRLTYFCHCSYDRMFPRPSAFRVPPLHQPPPSDDAKAVQGPAGAAGRAPSAALPLAPAPAPAPAPGPEPEYPVAGNVVQQVPMGSMGELIDHWLAN